MTIFSINALVRKWSPQIHYHTSSPNLAPRLHWILSSIMLTCHLAKRKPSNWSLRWILRCVPWLTSLSQAGLTMSRKSHIHYIATGNTVNHLLLKMDSCSVEKPLTSLHQKGRRSLVHCISHTKASSKYYCLPVDVFCGPVSTKPLKKLFGNVKCAWESRIRMLLHHSHQHLQLHIPGRYVHWIFSHWMVWITSSLPILPQANPVMQPPCRPSNSAKVIDILEEWFCDHDTTEVQHTDNGPQYASAAFADCSVWMAFYQWNLQSTLPTVQWMCQVMFQNNGAYTTMHQVEWYKSKTALQHLKATPVDVKLPSLSQMLYNPQDTYHNTIQDSQHWPSSPPSSRVLWGLSWASQVQCWEVLKVTCTILYWSAHCQICLPEENLDTPYCSWCHFKGELPSTHCHGTIYHCIRCHLRECSVKYNDAVPEPPSAI